MRSGGPASSARVEGLIALVPTLERNEVLVELMRIMALLGDRDGHSGMFVWDEQAARPLHAYPLFVDRFEDGLFVLRTAGDSALEGASLLAIGGVPSAEVEAKVRPLISRDSELTRTMRLPQWVVTAEVLHGLGITPTPASATWGDSAPIALPSLGWNVWSALEYLQYSRADDPRVAVEPHARVPLTSAEFFAGKDPVLAAALRLPG